MKNINLLINNSPKIVQVKRYFLSRDNAYLIYSDDNLDSDGNVKIYVAKIINNNRVAPIELQDEWDAVKKDIIGIVNANKENTRLLVQDMDYTNLNNLEITSSKALRLPGAVMPYLSANQPVFSAAEIEKKEQTLERKTISLQEMNQELDTSPTISNIETTEVKDPLEATMEVIMPTSSKTNEHLTRDDSKKEKFSLKSLFGIKKEEENITNMSQEPLTRVPTLQVKTTYNEPIKENKTTIVSESDLPKPKQLEPITIAENSLNMGKTRTGETKTIEIPVAPVGEVESIPPTLHYNEPVSHQTISQIEKPTNNYVGFEFFDAMTSEIPQRVNLSNNDVEYKSRYENTIRENQELKEQVVDLKKKLDDYKNMLVEIKNIVD